VKTAACRGQHSSATDCHRLAVVAKKLQEVADYAGVSEATVSRVLNDKPGVSGATRTAVLTALDVLGYERPGQLRQRPNRLVGHSPE